MTRIRIAKSLAVAAQLMMIIPALGVSRTQAPLPPAAQPPASSQASVSSQTQGDLYADAFAAVTYTSVQKEAIGKIQQDIASRKSAVVKDNKLTDAQKDAMLTGYTLMQYNLIYKELTPQQRKQVSTRIHARRASEQAAGKTPAPAK